MNIGKKVLYAAISAALVSGGVSANPTGAQIANGSVSIETSGAAMNITNSPNAIINWQGFSIGAGEITRFMQESSGSAVLNRVIGGSVSEILGQLQSNGRVFLINPNGLVIGGGASIDTAGFVGSTLNITDDDFLSGRFHFQGDGGKIVNRGYIKASDNGEVVLIAPDVENNGVIETDNGEIILAAGREVILTSLDHEHISFRVQAPGDRVLNLGKLIASDGAVGLFAGTVQQRGEISADRVSRGADGSIILQASSTVEVSGSVSAKGKGTQGGDIRILGDVVNVKGANINVSGDAGGGQILMGGDYQGQDETPTATRTSIDAGSRIRADALQNGDGGRIIAWSDTTTTVDGEISARGGPSGGDGGFVETSGKGDLDFSRPVDVSAPAGKPGTWLLDPENINIDGGRAASINSSLNNGSNVSIKTSDSGTGEGNIAVNAPISKTSGGDAALSMQAHNRIDVNAPITSTAGKLHVSLKAGRAVGVHAPVQTNGGNFSTQITGVAAQEPKPNDKKDDSKEESSKTGDNKNESADNSADQSSQDSKAEPAPTGNSGNKPDTEAASNPPKQPAVDPAAETVAPETVAPTVPDITPAAPAGPAPETVASAQPVSAPTSAPNSTPAPTPVPPVPVTQSAQQTASAEPAPAPQPAPPSQEPNKPTQPDSTPTAQASGPAQPATESSAAAPKTPEPDQEVVINADITTGGGDIHIDAGEKGTLFVRADVDSSSEKTDQKGGDIQLLGDRVGVFDTAKVDASGKAGGGEVLIGGDQQGMNPDVRNASAVYIGKDAIIRSDSTDNGDGGKVIVFAEDTANILGQLSAKGGVNGGDGGFVETSGKRNLYIEQAPDTSANLGQAGTWLIDPLTVTVGPYNVTVDDVSSSNNISNTQGTATTDCAATVTGCWQPEMPGAMLDIDDIKDGLKNGGNVVITTTGSPTGRGAADDGNITWLAYLDLDGNNTSGESSGALTLQAHNDIIFKGSIFDSGSGYYDNDDRLTGLTLTANQDGTGGGDVIISGDSGAVEIDVAGNINMSGDNLDIHGGTGANQDIDLRADGTVAMAFSGQATIRGGDAGSGNRVNVSADEIIFSDNGTATGGRGGDLTIRGGNLGSSNRVLVSADEATIKTSELSVLGGDMGQSGVTTGTAADSQYNSGTLRGSKELTIDAGEVRAEGGGQGQYNRARIESNDVQINVTSVGGGGNLSILGGVPSGTIFAGSRGNSAVISGSEYSGSPATIAVSVEGDILVQAGDDEGNDARLGQREYGEGPIPFSMMNLSVDGSINVLGTNQTSGSNPVDAAAEIFASETQDIAAGEDINVNKGSIAVQNIDNYGVNDATLMQTIHADGDIFVGSDNGLKPGVIELVGELSPDYYSSADNFRVTGTQSVTADGDMVIMGGGSDSFSGIDLRLSIDTREIVTPSPISNTLTGTQTVSALTPDKGLFISGGDDVGASAGVRMTGETRVSSGEISNTNNFTQNVNADELVIEAGTASQADGMVALDLNDWPEKRSGYVMNETISGASSQTINVTGKLSLSGLDPSTTAASGTDVKAIIGSQVLQGSVPDVDQIIFADTLDLVAQANSASTSTSAEIIHNPGPAGGKQEIEITGNALLQGEDDGNRAVISSTGSGGKIDIGGDLTMENTSAGGSDRNAATLISLAGTLDVANKTTLKGATLEGDGDITTKDFDWQEARIQGGDILNSTGAATISGTGEKVLAQRTWNNQGTAEWNSGDVSLENALINSSGAFIAKADNTLSDVTSSTSVFSNSGDFSKQSGAGDTRFTGVGFVNTGNVHANSGNLAFDGGYQQTAGNTDLSGGNISSSDAGGIAIEGGGLTGDGTIDSDLNVAVPGGTSAFVAPGRSPGTLNVTGNLVLGAGSTLNMEAAGTGAGQFDQIIVGGSAALNGAVNLDFISGYTPANGDSYKLIDSVSGNTGTFSAFAPGALPSGVTASENYNPADYTVSISGTQSTPANTPPISPVSTSGFTSGPGSPKFPGSPLLIIVPEPDPDTPQDVPDVTSEVVTLLKQLPTWLLDLFSPDDVKECTALYEG